MLAYTAGMVVVLYLTAGLIKGAKSPVNTAPKQPASHSAFWKTLWNTLLQRFNPPETQAKEPLASRNEPTDSLSSPVLTTKQTLSLDKVHTAHVLDSPDGRWLLVTGPTGTQLHALQGANSSDLGNRHPSLGHSATSMNSVIKPPLGVPDGWGRVTTRQSQLLC